MVHHHLEGFEHEWILVRETPSSQKFRVITPERHEMALDIHYTPSKILTVNIVFKGAGRGMSKGILTPLMEEIGRLALKRGDYAVIDYTLAETSDINEGNFSIDEKDRKIRQL